MKHIIESLAGLLAHIWEGLTPLLDMADAHHLVAERGFMHVYRNQREFDLALPANRIREEHGANFTALDAADIHDLEPNLKHGFERGLLFHGVNQTLDPLALCQCYARSLEQGDDYCRIVPARVLAIDEDSSGVKLSLDNGETHTADKVVIAAGAFSRFIEGIGKPAAKLDTERGYHVLYQDRQDLLARPVSWHFAGFYATPMNLGLRFAGTVELAGYEDKRNTRITDYLARKASQMLDLPPSPDQTWLGFRPTFPDSLPAIGYGPGSSRLLFAVGHHHLGLTLSGITGKLVAELAAGEAPSHDVGPFSAARFQ